MRIIPILVNGYFLRIARAVKFQFIPLPPSKGEMLRKNNYFPKKFRKKKYKSSRVPSNMGYFEKTITFRNILQKKKFLSSELLYRYFELCNIRLQNRALKIKQTLHQQHASKTFLFLLR